MQEPKIAKSKKPAPDTRSWYEYIWKAAQETPNRLEDAAKFLATMVSVSLTLFLAIGKASFEQYLAHPPIKIAVVSMLLSLLCAFAAMFPWHAYKYHSESVQTIKAMHRKIVRLKDTLLIASFLLFFAALGILAVAFF